MKQVSHSAPRFINQAIFITGLLVLTGVGHAAENGVLKLIELFTSHGCSSCPEADKLLGKLLEEHDELMALEYHVDYWNNLVHGSDGSFADPFSKPDHSSRQREYNHAKLAGRPGVYTPQAIVNGRVASVGSNERHIVKALSAGTGQSLSIVFDSESQSGESLRVNISGDDRQLEKLVGIDIRLVSYLDKATTDVTGGENRDLTLVNHHVVMNIVSLGEVTASGDLNFKIPRPVTGEGCVVLIQEDALTPVYAAAECP